MELRGGRGSQLEVEDIPYIVVEKIQPLVLPATHGSTAPRKRYYRDAARYYRGGPRYYRGSSTGRTKPELGAVLLLARYYRSPCGTTARQEGHGLGRARTK